MKRFYAVALLVAGIALPVWGQHGGGHSGGFAGGFARGQGGFSGHAGASHAAPSFHPGARPSPGPRGPVNPSRSFGYRPNFGAMPATGARSRPETRYGAQPMHYGAQGLRRSPYRPPYRRPYGGGIVYGSPYAYPAYYPVYPYDIGDDGYFGDDSTGAPYYTDPDAGAQGQIDPGVPYLPYYGGSRPAPTPVSPQDKTGPQPVTLVFKDGRPNQQIHNFLINGNTITVWDRNPHDIPVDQLNAAATEKINHDAGVDLLLPPASK